MFLQFTPGADEEGRDLQHLPSVQQRNCSKLWKTCLRERGRVNLLEVVRGREEVRERGREWRGMEERRERQTMIERDEREGEGERKREKEERREGGRKGGREREGARE